MKKKYENLFSLLMQVIKRLETGSASFDGLEEALGHVVEYFSFACGFVYECDHTDLFWLRESRVFFPGNLLPETIRLENHITPAQIDELSKTAVMFFSEHSRKTDLSERLGLLFGARSLLIYPIVDQEQHLVGCVGMADRRNVLGSSGRRMQNDRRHRDVTDELPDEEDIEAARMLLEMLAIRIRLRICGQRLAFTRTTLESIMDNTGIDIYVNDFDTHEVLYANKSMAAPYGGLKNLMGKRCWEALYDDKTGECAYCPRRHLIDESGNPTRVYQWDYQRPFDGLWFRVLCSAFRWTDGRLAQVVSSVDITESKRNEALIERMAYYDTLTGIPNRRKLEKDFQVLTTGPDKNDARVALMFLDLDNFKSINDSFGHEAGDELLCRIATTLQEDPLTKDRIYRHGGDEFIMIYDNVPPEELRRIGEYLLELFGAPWRLTSNEIFCGASVGIARYPEDAADYQSLLNAADAAMYRAKAAGKGRICEVD